jgi:kynureninase
VSNLAAHYSRFRVSERLLLTGHSHQAWPDVGFEAQQRAWLDAAEFVDDKWERAEAQADQVRAGFARLLGTSAREIALGQNTHELVTRWLSALPLAQRPRLVTTDGEFHSMRRQLDRLAEERIQVVRIAAHPVETLADRLAAEVTDDTAAVLVSSVLYETAEIVPGLTTIAAACARHGARLLVDAYHHVNVVPFDLSEMGLLPAFITGGGYKYCQLGEGNCFLRVPPHENLRPLLTGWFAEFAEKERTDAAGVTYPPGAGAFLGATYDPVSHYRAAAVFDFHVRQGLDPTRLRRTSQRQVSLLERRFDALDLDPAVANVVAMPGERRGGFLAIQSPYAQDFRAALHHRGVRCDARGTLLRFGPAPYLRDDQLTDAIDILGEVVTSGWRPR